MKIAYRQESSDPIVTLNRLRLVKEGDLPVNGRGTVAAMQELIATEMMSPCASVDHPADEASIFELIVSNISRLSGYVVLGAAVVALVWLVL